MNWQHQMVESNVNKFLINAPILPSDYSPFIFKLNYSFYSMAQCIINGISVSFPYEPYNVQKEYMSKVIECLKKSVSGILESPTGTGKTLSLLCSSLAWLESRKAQQQLALIQQSAKENGSDLLKDLKLSLDTINGCWDAVPSLVLPKIIYSSRTHSQLSQAVQELKRSNYKHVKAVVLGSRDQLCIHPEVSKAANHTVKVYMCRTKISTRSCPFYLNYEEKIISTLEYQETPVTDIEDLIVLGKKHKVCPYYAARNLKTKADIVFTPYNYIIDPKSRRAHGTELQGNVLIFDEAHNIESACEESLSFQLRSYDLALCITEVSQTMDKVKDFDSNEFNSSDNGAPDFTLTDLSILKVMFCELEDILDKAVSECSGNGVKPGDYIIEVLSKVELTFEKMNVVIELLEKIILYNFTGENNPLGAKGAGLQKFSDLLNILFYKTDSGGRNTGLKQEFAVKYKVSLQYETKNKSQNSADPWAASSKKKQSWKLDFWCFSPHDRMQEIVDKGVHSIILTSGTLSPLGPMMSELGINFPVQLENPHIIKNNQVFVGVITCGPDGTPLNSSYQNRFNANYISSLGRTICNFCRVVPDGLLVFFPSYSVLRFNQENWEENGVWRSLSGIKPIFLEPQQKDAFQESIEMYYSAIQDPSCKGATLMAVCRGKVSEGLDFADRNARGVVITGLPFPPSMDPRVKLKMEYLNSIAKTTKGIQGNDWYVLQASRAVNQAIGRVIRHKNDFGAILLCDNRFQQKHIQQQLSKWIHGCISVYDSFGPALKQLSSFFKFADQESLKAKSSVQRMGSFQINGTVLCSSSSGLQRSSNQEIKFNENAENILESYKKEKGEGLSSASISSGPSSIFDAFEETHSMTKNPTSVSKPSCSSYATKENGILPKPAVPREAKKRKICIEFRTADVKEEKETPAQKWKNFLLEIKALFKATDKYGAFCCAIKEYKSGQDVQKFAVALTSIFSEIPNKKKYIETASLLVDSKHREKFLSACSERSP